VRIDFTIDRALRAATITAKPLASHWATNDNEASVSTPATAATASVAQT
jgi:hypothetical protein